MDRVLLQHLLSDSSMGDTLIFEILKVAKIMHFTKLVAENFQIILLGFVSLHAYFILGPRLVSLFQKDLNFIFNFQTFLKFILLHLI
jgi:hypothetical protein